MAYLQRAHSPIEIPAQEPRSLALCYLRLSPQIPGLNLRGSFPHLPTASPITLSSMGLHPFKQRWALCPARSHQYHKPQWPRRACVTPTMGGPAASIPCHMQTPTRLEVDRKETAGKQLSKRQPRPPKKLALSPFQFCPRPTLHL